ncbi:MAG: enoyl-CoA hydratase-related protein, partial [Vicinamibacterales bacterium]
RMLAGATHAHKVNFCKFTNETRNGLEDSSENSGQRFVTVINGTAAGGGYELALATDHIIMADDGAAAVALPEVPLLAVLPGTGGLTRVVDKRKVRRDLADDFSTLTEGVRGKRAVEGRFVDATFPTSKFQEAVAKRAQELAAMSDRPKSGPGLTLGPLSPAVQGDVIEYKYVKGSIDRAKRTCELTVSAPDSPQPKTADEFMAAGDQSWAIRAFRELDDVLLRLRFNEPEIGTVIVRALGDPQAVLDVDQALHANREHWLVREIIGLIRRTLKRMDLTARSFFALIEPGNAFAGTLFELALAADRAYMIDHPDEDNTIQLSLMNGGDYPMSNGLSRLQVRFLGEPESVDKALAQDGPFDAQEACQAGLIFSAPDDIDWDDEVRMAIEARAAFSPDALTGMEANLRFAGPETLETKIFGRLTAWQNWIFQRPNAVGDKGALMTYGREGRPQFDFKRT